MKYKVTLNDKVYEVEVEAGKAVLLDEYEACAPAPAAAPAAEAAPAAAAPGSVQTPGCPSQADPDRKRPTFSCPCNFLLAHLACLVEVYAAVV